MIGWKLPTEDWFKLNVDDSVIPYRQARNLLLRAIKLLLAHPWNVRVSHVYRGKNFCADLLAKKVHLCQIGLTCFSSPPAFLSTALMADAFGLNFS
ncbi:hypothetical protein AHAS_Ahas13G0094800 [Arachis hypogaea]